MKMLPLVFVLSLLVIGTADFVPTQILTKSPG
jgi:hypothetical protein